MNKLTGPELRAAIVLASGGLMAVLDATIVAVALPQLMAAFGTSLTSVQWIITAYTLAMVATMPLAAGLAARWGARRVYLVALAGFAVASAVAGAAGGLGWLIAARAAQGLAGGLMTPLGMTIGFGAVAPERRGRMMAVTGLPMLIGLILGPVLGAVLLGTGSWRALFFITVPLALLGAAGTLTWLPVDTAHRQRVRLDLAGAMLLVPGIVVVAYGISAQDSPGWARIATAAIGAVLVAMFSARALIHPEPLLRIRLLGHPTFGRGAAVLALYTAPYFGSALLMPAYVQTLRFDSTSVTAALMVPGAVGMGLSLQVAARLLERLGPRLVVGTGLGLAISSGLVQVVILRPDTPYLMLGLFGFLQGAGTGATMMPTMSSSSRDLHGPDLASGSALLSLINTIANGMGTVAVSALFTVLIAAMTGGASLATLTGPGTADRAALAVTITDALRLTQVAALIVMSVALVVRLRLPRRPRRYWTREIHLRRREVCHDHRRPPRPRGEPCLAHGRAGGQGRRGDGQRRPLLRALRRDHRSPQQRQRPPLHRGRDLPDQLALAAQRVGITLKESADILAGIPPLSRDLDQWVGASEELVRIGRARVDQLQATVNELATLGFLQDTSTGRPRA